MQVKLGGGHHVQTVPVKAGGWGIRSPGTAVTDGSGLLNVGARNLALVLYKSHKFS